MRVTLYSYEDSYSQTFPTLNLHRVYYFLLIFLLGFSRDAVHVLPPTAHSTFGTYLHWVGPC